MKKEKRIDIWKIISIAVLIGYVIFLLWPLVKLFYSAFYNNGKFTIEQFVNFFSKKYYRKSITNSLKVSSLATLITLIIGIPLAYFYQMYEIGRAHV